MKNKTPLVLPGEIMAEILLRLPILPLFKLSCVSKQWKSIISDPKFGLDYIQHWRSSSYSSSSRRWAILYPYVNPDSKLKRHLKDLIKILSSTSTSTSTSTIRETRLSNLLLSLISTTDPPKEQQPLSVSYASLPIPKPKDESFITNDHEIIASSNGLVLSSTKRLLLYVSNPLTRKYAPLSSSVNLDDNFVNSKAVFGLATRSMSYKVVLIRRRRCMGNDFNSTVQIFSSDTGSWEILNINSPQVVLVGAKDEAFSYKGVLHWLDRVERTIITYDPYDNPGCFGSIRLPNTQGITGNLVYTGGDDGFFKYAELELYPTIRRLRLCVWGLMEGGEWRLQHWCRIDPYWDRAWLVNNRKPIASDPWNEEILWYSYAHEQCAIALDVGTGRKRFVGERKRYDLRKQVFPLAWSPWASPFYYAQGS